MDVTILITTHTTDKQLDCLSTVLLSIKAYLDKEIPILICHDSVGLNELSKKQIKEKFEHLKKILNFDLYFGDRSFNFNNKNYKFNTVGCNMLDLILKCNTKYFLMLEHDWLFLKKINVNNIIKLLNENININYIRFQQRNYAGGWDTETKYIEKYDLSQTNGFTNHPYISRKSFWMDYMINKLIIKRVGFIEEIIHNYLCNDKKLSYEMGLFLYKNIGNESMYIKHLDGSDHYWDRDINNSARGYTKEQLYKTSSELKKIIYN